MGYKDGGYDADRYVVTKRTTGEPIGARTFSLVPDHDIHAHNAILFYADSVETENAQLAADLREAFGDE